MNSPWLWIALLLAAGWVVNQLLNRVMASQRGERLGLADEPLPYRRKDYLLSKAELSFYEVLRQALAQSDQLVFAKVRLLDLVWLPKGTPNPQGWRNRVQSKHVDFVLCNRRELRPELVIELDDKSHEEDDRQVRDAFVDRALAAAGLPILHLSARRTYSTRELSEQIRSSIAGHTTGGAGGGVSRVAQ